MYGGTKEKVSWKMIGFPGAIEYMDKIEPFRNKPRAPAYCPRNAGKNLTGAVGALAYWAVGALKSRYLKNPVQLVRT
jgi:hypothetical protein